MALVKSIPANFRFSILFEHVICSMLLRHLLTHLSSCSCLLLCHDIFHNYNFKRRDFISVLEIHILLCVETKRVGGGGRQTARQTEKQKS